MCAQRRLRSAWASADPSLRWAHSGCHETAQNIHALIIKLLDLLTNHNFMNGVNSPVCETYL